MDHVIAKTGMSKPTLSRIETGQRACTSHEAVAILTALAITGAERERLFNLTLMDDQQAWLGVGSGLAQHLRALTAYTLEAAEFVDIQLALIPGILQTAEYARAVVSTGPLNEEAREKAVAARIGRQATLSRPNLRYTAFIDENALRRKVGSADVMKGQYEQLIQLGQRPTVSVRVIPFSAGNHRGCDGSFALFELKDSARVVYLETQTTGIFLDEPEKTDPYVDVVASVQTSALSEPETRTLLLEYQGESG